MCSLGLKIHFFHYQMQILYRHYQKISKLYNLSCQRVSDLDKQLDSRYMEEW